MSSMSGLFGSNQYKIIVEGESLDFDSQEHRLLKSTISCSCGNRNLNINFIPPPCCTGGYIRVTCPRCGASEVLLDDYS